jgi:putative serine protease PepD
MLGDMNDDQGTPTPTGASADTMTDGSPIYAPDPTTPLPPPAYGSYGPPPSQPTPTPSSGRPRRGAFAASVVAASLLLGGGAGVGGAALWTSTHDDTTTTAAQSATSPVVDQNDNAPAEGSVEQVAAAVLPSVVKIDVTGQQEAGSGSGIILSADGEILTNNHVVEVAGSNGSIRVAFNDGTYADAKVLGTDPLTDTAVIKAEGVSGLTPATIGSSANLKVGQQVVAIGSPFGLESTVTTGIVSALNRPVNVGSDGAGNSTTYPAIQTDAAINPGNSGGPLVDMSGDVVGINSSIRTASSSSVGGQSGSIGLGFAIPIDEVMPIVDQMINGETPTHARIGIGVSALSGSNTSLIDGAQVSQVNPGSPAEKAGLQVGDVITKVDDHQITDPDSLVATVRSYRPGDKVEVTWVRDGKTQSATVTLASDATSSNS